MNNLNWVSPALISAAMRAGVSIVDSHLVSKRRLELRTLMLPMGIVQVLFGSVLYLLFPWPKDIPAIAILSVILAGIFGIAGTIITLFVLQGEEVSKVVPIGYTTPVFIAIIAAIFLGESLTYIQWLAIVIVAAGAMLISVERSQLHLSGMMKRPISLMFLSSLMAALGSIFTKVTLGYLSFWNVYSMAILIVAVISIALAVRPHTFSQWRIMKQRGPALVLIVINEIIALSASLIYIHAVSLGPVSLVSTIGGIRPFLVLAFSLILGLVLPGFLLDLPGKGTLILRLAAIVMIVGGVSIISFA